MPTRTAAVSCATSVTCAGSGTVPPCASMAAGLKNAGRRGLGRSLGSGLIAASLPVPVRHGDTGAATPSRAVARYAARRLRGIPLGASGWFPPPGGGRQWGWLPEVWTATARSATPRARLSPCHLPDRCRRGTTTRSSSRSTTRPRCTGTSGWSATACSSRGRCPRGCRSTRSSNRLAVHDRGPPAGVRRLRGRHPAGRVRRRPGAALGPRHATRPRSGPTTRSRWSCTARGCEGRYVLFRTGGPTAVDDPPHGARRRRTGSRCPTSSAPMMATLRDELPPTTTPAGPTR